MRRCIAAIIRCIVCGSIFRGREAKECLYSWLARHRATAFLPSPGTIVMVPLGLLGCCVVCGPVGGWLGVDNVPNTLIPPPTSKLKIEKERKEKQKSVTGRLLSHRCHRDGALRAVWGRDWRGSNGLKGRWWWWWGLNSAPLPFSLTLSLLPPPPPKPLAFRGD